MTKSMFLATCLVVATLVSGMLLVQKLQKATRPPQWEADPLAM